MYPKDPVVMHMPTHSTTQSKSTGRLFEMDALRGFAAIAVVLFHYTTHYGESFGHPIELPFDVFWGRYGVNLFFVISGFVITLSLESYNAREFVLARFTRLFPTYWVSVCLTFACLIIFSLPKHNPTFLDFLINLTMLQYFFNVRDMDGVYWTLIYELCFYTIMLAVSLTNNLKRLERLGTIWLLLIISSAIGEKFLGLHVPDRISVALILNHGQLFFAGVIFYKMRLSGITLRRNLLIALCLLAQAIVADGSAFIATSLSITIFYLLVVGRLRWLNQPVFVYLGTISYSLYLIHQYIGYMMMRYLYSFLLPPLVVISVTLLLVIGLASMISFLIEQPILRWTRNYIRQQRRHVLSPSPSR